MHEFPEMLISWLIKKYCGKEINKNIKARLQKKIMLALSIKLQQAY